MRLIVCGSRTFSDYPLLKRKLDRFTKRLDKKKLIVVSGAARGADELGEKWAYENWITVERHHPDYARHGKAAPLVRNEDMVKASRALVCFWDGVSPGSRHVITLAKKKGIQVRVIRF